jgi:hypothetical protein
MRYTYTNHGDTVYKKQARLKTPSLRFPLLAGGTEPVRGSPREAGGTCRRGAIVNSTRAIGMTGDGAVDDGDLNVVLFNFGSGC